MVNVNLTRNTVFVADVLYIIYNCFVKSWCICNIVKHVFLSICYKEDVYKLFN